MSTSDVPIAVSAPGGADESWIERWSPIGGLLFVVGAVVVALTPAGDDTGETVAEVVRFARDNDDWMAVALVFALASLLLLGWFVTGLYLRLRNAGARREAILAFVGGMILTLLFFWRSRSGAHRWSISRRTKPLHSRRARRTSRSTTSAGSRSEGPGLVPG